MPGAIIMENGAINGVATNHDRAKLTASTSNGVLSNGINNGSKAIVRTSTDPSRWNDLPDEITHITQGFVPLGILVARLAQRSHNALQDTIMAMAKMPLPASTQAVNGNAVQGGPLPDDSSVENIRKKAHLLEFVKEEHARWVKALVMTSWSRKAETVSKLIDLYNAINMQKVDYLRSVEHLIDIRTALPTARLGAPDLRTALQILSTGEATWMPDIGYIEPPAISPKEKLEWIENTNTLLSLRLNIEEHDKLPSQFKDYKIESGRVTFQVPGEFEVDLTIADEDFEKQFWFIDFRFGFTPAPAELSGLLRQYLEVKVNECLEKDGLRGCFNFLHEFILTHKITEYVRQAFTLRQNKWVDTLKVERLNRAISIQYWANRQPDAPKSWILLGVHSGRHHGMASDATATSRLTLRWFKDNKEVSDAQIPLVDGDISTERLLKRVIGRHVKSNLGAIFTRLVAKGRFAKREAALSLHIDEDEPVQSALKMQIGRMDTITLKVVPTTGQYAISPQTGVTAKGENRMNLSLKDPTEEGVMTLENVRCYYTVDELNRRGRSMGWDVCRPPVRMDDIKPILNTREPFQSMWFRRRGWPEKWFLMLSLSLGGDRWWLVEITADKVPRIASANLLSLSAGLPELSDKFFYKLTFFTVTMIAQMTDKRHFKAQGVDFKEEPSVNPSLPPGLRVPGLRVKLSDILRRPNSQAKQGKSPAWALDTVHIMFKGIHATEPAASPAKAENSGGNAPLQTSQTEQKLSTSVDARFKVVDPERFSMLSGSVERDVVFNKQLGVFALHLQTDLGVPMLDTLRKRLQAIERLVDCIDAIRRCDRDVRCENITLQQITFSYTSLSKADVEKGTSQPAPRRTATLDLSTDDIRLRLERGDPQLRVVDMYDNLLNSSLRFAQLPLFLSMTSTLHQSLDAIEAAWFALTTENKGRVEVFVNSLQSFNVRYTLPGATATTERRASLQICLRERKGTLYWFVHRLEPGPDPTPNDVFKEALDSVWAAGDRKWRNLTGGAACQLGQDIEKLLTALDNAIRPLALQSPKAIRQSISKTSGPKGQGTAAQAKNQGNKARPQPSQQTADIVVLD